MWPFKKKEPVMSWSEYLDTLPEPMCKDKKEHYHWELNVGWNCPLCAGIEKQREKEADEDRLAKKIAKEIYELNNKTRN